MKNEKKFYDSLQKIFVGAPLEGEGGYVNLLKIKEKYYSKVISNLKKEIDEDKVITESFKENFYDMLFNFFEKYFNECGSVYFAKTANWQRVYEKVYNDNKDVVLFWKTHMLYYVKSDILFQNIYVKSFDETDNLNYVFYFDVGTLKQKQNNEKKELVFTFKEIKIGKVNDVHDETTGDKTFVLSVTYSENRRCTDLDEISLSTKVRKNVIEKAINIFKKQTTIDFFINKNAKVFLEEQLDLFLNQYLLDDTMFNQERLNQIKAVKKYAKNIISFISQFENELVRIWNKPKFVKNSNYVISFKTLKKVVPEEEYESIKEGYWNVLKKKEECLNDIFEIIHETYKRPLQNLYVGDIEIKNKFHFNFNYIKFFKDDEKGRKNAEKIAKGKNIENFKGFIVDKGEKINGYIFKYDNNQTLKKDILIDEIFLDTKFMSNNEKNEFLSILSRYTAIDTLLNGVIVKSDNYQFLNSANKYKKSVELVYIDPPFNTNTEGFAFIDGFKDSSWLTLMQDRYNLIYDKFMSDNSSLYVHGDHHCNYYMRLLLDGICGQDNFNREIIWNTSPAISGQKAGPKVKNFIRQHDTIFFYIKGKPVFNKLFREYKNNKNLLNKIGWLDMYCDENKVPYLFKYDNNGNIEKIDCSDINVMALGDVWNDVYSMMYSQNMTRENWGKSNTQKPENLIRRFIQVSSNINDYVMDIFVGSGTTVAAAHKLGRKWIGVDSGTFIDDIVVKRMKSVLMGDCMPKLSEDLNWKGGGFFKYYELEQYEDTLNKASYSADIDSLFADDIFNQYVFFADDKFANVLKIKENGDFELNFDNLYENIDFPETISLLYGKPIEKIDEDYVKLVDIKDPIKYNVSKMNNEEKLNFVKLLKPLLWWGE